MILAVQDQALVVDLAVEVDRELRHAQQGPIDRHEPRGAVGRQLRGQNLDRGDPVKPLEVQAGDGRLHPRHSFEAWTQVVRGSSRPWRIAEIDAAEDLRRRAIETDLTNQITNAERALHLRDEMVAVVSHDLKSPLQVIEMACTLIQGEIETDARTVITVGRIQRAVARMNALVHDLLEGVIVK